MDDREIETAKRRIDCTTREHTASSLTLPVLKSRRSKNHSSVSGLLNDEATKRTINELADTSLLTTHSQDNDAVENGTSIENYICVADDEDESLASCSNDNICVDVETLNNFQSSGGQSLVDSLKFLIC